MKRIIPVLLLAFAACSNATSPSDNAQDSFTGTLSPRGVQTQEFSMHCPSSCEYSVKLNTMSPDQLVVNLFVAEYVTGVCQLNQVITEQPATAGGIPIVGNLPGGDFCAGVADPDAPLLPRAETFNITISHP